MELYGYQPPSITSPLKGKYKFQAMEDHIEHRQEILQTLKDNLINKKYPKQDGTTIRSRS